MTLTSASVASEPTKDPLKYITVDIERVVSGDVVVDENGVPLEYSTSLLKIAASVCYSEIICLLQLSSFTYDI